MLKSNKIINIKLVIFTFIVWGFLNLSGIQKIFFLVDEVSLKILIIKFLHLLFLYTIFAIIYNLFRVNNNEEKKCKLKITILYFIVLIILNLLVWPGLWSWDDIFILNEAATYGLTAWQHFFSGLFHILCLQTIPIATGVMIIQSIISSLIAGYCVSKLSYLFGKSKKQRITIQIILFLILLFPPVIAYILSGFRMGIYSFFELFLITYLMTIYKEKIKISYNEAFILVFLTTLVSSWRSEAFYYPIVLLVILIILGKTIVSKKMVLLIVGLVLVFNYFIGSVNNYLIGNNNYSLLATLEPLTQLVKNSTKEDEKELTLINSIIDVKYIKNHNLNGEQLYWTEGVVKKYNNKEFINYLKSYAILSIRHPDILIQSMWKTFYNSGSGLGYNGYQTTRNIAFGSGNTVKLFESKDGSNQQWINVNSYLKNPINLSIREKVSLFICGINSEYKLTIIHTVFWNLFLPFILILIGLIYKIIKRDWSFVFIILLVVCRIPLVFITSPAPYFMYYLSSYLCTYILSTIILFELIFKKKEEAIRKV